MNTDLLESLLDLLRDNLGSPELIYTIISLVLDGLTLLLDSLCNGTRISFNLIA